MNRNTSDLHILYKRIRNDALTQPARDPQYLAWVKKHPCLACGNPTVDPHHLFGSVNGLKSSDYYTIPLCRAHHDMAHADQAMNVELVFDLVTFMHTYFKESR